MKVRSASLLDHQPNASLFDLMEEIERRIISIMATRLRASAAAMAPF
jgi:hypothetical protein